MNEHPIDVSNLGWSVNDIDLSPLIAAGITAAEATENLAANMAREHFVSAEQFRTGRPTEDEADRDAALHRAGLHSPNLVCPHDLRHYGDRCPVCDPR